MSMGKYQVFLKVAACGGFTRAAEELHFTQSGVSHTIAALESELGVPLFVRNRSGVTLTADGRALLPYVQALCDDALRLEQKAADLRGMETGLVRVATFNSVSVQWLPYLLKSFRAEHPHIEFELLPSNFNNEIEDWVPGPGHLAAAPGSVAGHRVLRSSHGRAGPLPPGCPGLGAVYLPAGGGRLRGPGRAGPAAGAAQHSVHPAG